MNVKILFVCQSLTIKSEWIYRLIRHLKNEIVCIATNRINSEIQGPQVFLNPFAAKILRRIPQDFSINFFYKYILKKVENEYHSNLNYFHFLTFSVNFKNFILSSKSPTLIHCHGIDVTWDLKDATSGKLHYNEKYFQSINSISNEAYFLANSTYTRSQLLKLNIPEDRIFMSHFGIEVPKIPKNKNEDFNILYLGRLVDCKGPLEVIKAFEMACAKGMEGKLTLAGGGIMEQECRTYLQRSEWADKIEVLGWVKFERARELFMESHLFTAHNKIDRGTNQVEAFGVSILEAMAYGLPVITGKSGGVGDSIIDGETGFLIEPGDIEAHCEKFLLLYENKELRESMGENGKLRVDKFFNKKLESERLNKIFQTILMREKKDSCLAS